MNLYLLVEKALAFNSLSGGGRTEPAQGVKFTGAKGASFTGGASIPQKWDDSPSRTPAPHRLNTFQGFHASRSGLADTREGRA